MRCMKDCFHQGTKNVVATFYLTNLTFLTTLSLYLTILTFSSELWDITLTEVKIVKLQEIRPNCVLLLIYINKKKTELRDVNLEFQEKKSGVYISQLQLLPL